MYSRFLCVVLIFIATFLKGQFIEANFELEYTTSAYWGISLSKDGKYLYYISVYKGEKKILDSGLYKITNSILSFYSTSQNKEESLATSSFKITKRKFNDRQIGSSIYPYSQVTGDKDTYWVLTFQLPKEVETSN